MSLVGKQEERLIIGQLEFQPNDHLVGALALLVVLTVKGKAAAVVQDAEAYQRLLDIAAHADPAEGIRQGLQDVREGRVRPAREFFDTFEAGRGIPR